MAPEQPTPAPVKLTWPFGGGGGFRDESDKSGKPMLIVAVVDGGRRHVMGARGISNPDLPIFHTDRLEVDGKGGLVIFGKVYNYPDALEGEKICLTQVSHIEFDNGKTLELKYAAADFEGASLQGFYREAAAQNVNEKMVDPVVERRPAPQTPDKKPAYIC